MEKPTGFAHLHTHTLFSLLDGVASPQDYFRACAERKWPALAITEHGVLNSIPDAYLASKEFKVKYIAGCEIYFNDYELLRQEMAAKGAKKSQMKEEDPELAARMGRARHLTLLCKNKIGYDNLLKINKYAWEFGFYYKPRVWFDVLAKHHEGLIVLSGCMNGPISAELLAGNYSSHGQIIGVFDYIKKFRQVFGDDFYLELQMPGVDRDLELFNLLSAVAAQKKIKTVLTGDAHYIKKEDYEVQKVMMAIDQDTTIKDEMLWHSASDEGYFKTREDFRQTFLTKGYDQQVSLADFERACDTTLEIADKCQNFKPDLDPKLPIIQDADSTLYKLTLDSLKAKGLYKDQRKFIVDGKEVTFKQQMVLELDRIIKKKFSSYFLITRDLIQHAKDNGLPPGPGRGSCAGSLVSYLLGITTINPLLFGGLSFDRFMSPSRGGDMLVCQMPKKEQKNEPKKAG